MNSGVEIAAEGLPIVATGVGRANSGFRIAAEGAILPADGVRTAIHCDAWVNMGVRTAVTSSISRATSVAASGSITRGSKARD